MIRKIQKVVLSLLLLVTISPQLVLAQDTESQEIPEELPVEEDFQVPAEQPKNEFYTGRVLEILDETAGDDQGLGYGLPTQKVKVEILNGLDVGMEVEIDHGAYFAIRDDQKVKAGDKVVVVKAQDAAGDIYVITDHYRIDSMLILLIVLLALMVGMGGVAVVRILALSGISVIVLINYLIPQIVEGKDPLMLTVIASVVFGALFVYVYEGISKKSIVYLSSFILTILASMYALKYLPDFARISGFGSEEAVFLQIGPYAGIDLKNMLLGAFIFAAVAPMVYIGRKQFGFIEEKLGDRKKLTKMNLAVSSMLGVGETTTMIYFVLVFGFVAVSFPLFLLLNFNQDVPLWVALNSEYFAEEIARLMTVGLIIYVSVLINAFIGVYFLAPSKKVRRTKK